MPKSTSKRPILEINNIYWKELSHWYRNQQNWICEECSINLREKPHFLHTHHKRGRRYNSPQDLMALCIECHSNQTKPKDHSYLKKDREYFYFLRWKEKQLRKEKSQS